MANPVVIKDTIDKRGIKFNLDSFLELYKERKIKSLNLETLRSKSNRIAKDIPKLSGANKQEAINQGRKLNIEITSLEEEIKNINELYDKVILNIPNLLAPNTPLGYKDSSNLILKTYLEPRQFDFVPKDHVMIGKALDLIDFDSGTKVTGPKFYFLKNEAILLELALKMFAINMAIKCGYIALGTPDLAKKSILTGAGFSPRGEESNIYNIENLDLGLIATAEITVGGMHADEIIAENALPLKYVAESHCFRREAGGAGKENKGLYRVHQFSKIELFQITQPEAAEAALEEILNIEETIYQKLELPYRVVRVCAGELGAAAYKKYDIEVWMPGRESEEKYGEVTSASNCTDFQSRRLNIKYRTKDNQKFYPYTLNGTAIAISRTLLAIIENYQQKDGSVVIPSVLRPYIGKDIITAVNLQK